ncbi:ribonuclease E [Herbihabitans rhizosphaerae]|uniref:Ribonuclease E n=1 Tax=Herbihabitans rhizosphaerae TaxID=1872711 RepID=A0A4Q7KDR9_9PSEU|nr:ribonuclease E/G [Herbihabitans rhizosphaerae]RZS31394.1 ribonuclease E [Herbihabitans rhizosphaerae]
MSKTETPAGSTGGDTTTPTNTALAGLPAKVRVHALAKLLGSSSRDVMAALTQLGEPVRSAQSSVAKEVALKVAESLGVTEVDGEVVDEVEAEPDDQQESAPGKPPAPVFASASPLFLPPSEQKAAKPVNQAEPAPAPVEERDETSDADSDADGDTDGDADGGDDEDANARRRRRRGRRGRGRGKGGPQGDADDAEDKGGDKSDKSDAKSKSGGKDDQSEQDESDEQASDDGDSDGGNNKRRRRRRRRRGTGDDGEATTEDDPPNTVVHVREAREEKSDSGRDEVRSVRGSTRLEAKRQRRRDGREAGRRRAPVLSEAEFLARREAVERTMIVREHGDRVQMAVLEDGVLVEHFVTSQGSGSLVGNVYLGRVQNVLPSMEAAFVDIGRGRNAVLYAGEVDWDAAGLEGKARKIEQALSTGDSVLVQVTKDPVGHKGARLTTQISLPGRFLVYVPGGGATGISRKLPENERRRLKDILKRVVPEDAGVIIRTASEGISEEELDRDVRRLQAQWQVIKDKSEGGNGVKRANAPALLYEEPDLLIKVVRDLFTEDFASLVVEGDDAWDTIDSYVRHVAPELSQRLRRHVSNKDVFAEYRVDEQLLKALDRKVWLPSGGYLIIDRTEAMTVIDVNTGKFTGSGGNLEETVTRNNLESAEEIVRQLRLRDIGGIIVIDFIDMVLESNRDLVLRRLTECLGRDRTRHQVAEVTSLGLVQMTRKRVGTGLLEAFSTTCEHCKGRGLMVSTEPVTKSGGGGGSNGSKSGANGSGRRSRGRGNGEAERVDKGAEKADKAAEKAKDAAREAVGAIAKAAAKEHDKDRKRPQSEEHAEDTTGSGAPTGSDSEATRDTGQRNGHGPGQAAEPAAGPAVPEQATEQATEEPEPQARPARRRSRRTASRPAGPPVNALPES